MNLKNLFYIDYWLAQPDAISRLGFWFLMAIFLLLFLGGIGLGISIKYQTDKIARQITRRFAIFGKTMGFFGLVWLFFREQEAYFLAWRLWLLVWFLAALWWLIIIFKYIVRRAPEIREEGRRQEEIAKYLP